MQKHFHKVTAPKKINRRVLSPLLIKYMLPCTTFYSQFGVIALFELTLEDSSSVNFAKERYCNLTLSALSSVLTTYLCSWSDVTSLKDVSFNRCFDLKYNKISLFIATPNYWKVIYKITCRSLIAFHSAAETDD